MEDTKSSGIDRCGCLKCINSTSGCFTSNQANVLIRNKVIECADRIGTAADTGENGIRQSAFLLHKLFLDLFADNSLKITNHLRERIRSHNRTKNIMSIFNSGSPFTEGFGNGIL